MEAAAVPPAAEAGPGPAVGENDAPPPPPPQVSIIYAWTNLSYVF